MDLEIILNNIREIRLRTDRIKTILFAKYYDMIKDIKINLASAEVPIIPFLWDREGHSQFGIIKTDIITKDEVYANYGYDSSIDLFYIEQSWLPEDKNIYLSLHSLLYYELHKDNIPGDKILVIPEKYNISEYFEVMIVPLRNTKIIEVQDGLKINQYVQGLVYIHDKSFSPTGTLHFKVDIQQQVNEFICYIRHNKLNINIGCLFVLKDVVLI